MRPAVLIVGVGIVAVSAIGVAAQRSTASSPWQSIAPVVTPHTAGVTSAAIQGLTLTALSGPLPNANIRLRDVRSGRVTDGIVSDKAGAFIFRRVEPGSYVVELIGSDHTVLAASQILNANVGELISTVVKLPFRIPVAGLLSRSAPTLLAVVAAGAAAGVLASTITGQPVSPVR